MYILHGKIKTSSTVIIHHRLRRRVGVMSMSTLLYLVVLTATTSSVLSAAEGLVTCSNNGDDNNNDLLLVGANANNYPPDEAYEIDGLSTDRLFTTIQPFLTLQRHWENYNVVNSNGVDSNSNTNTAAVDSYDPSVYCGTSDPVLYIPETIHWYIHYYVPPHSNNDNTDTDTTTGHGDDDDTLLLPQPKIYMSPPNIVIPFISAVNLNNNQQQQHEDQQGQSLSFQYNMSYSINSHNTTTTATTTSTNEEMEMTEANVEVVESSNPTPPKMKVFASIHVYLPTPNSIGTRGSRNEQFPLSYGRDIVLRTPEVGDAFSSNPTTFKIGSNTNIVHVINDSNRSLRIHDRSHNDVVVNDNDNSQRQNVNDQVPTTTPRNRIYIQKRYDPTASISSSTATTACIGGTRGADIEYNAYGTNTYCHIQTVVVASNNNSTSTSTSINSNCSSLYLSQQPIRSYNKLHTSGTNNTIYMSIVNSASSSGSSSSSSSPSPSSIKLSHRIQGELYGNDGTLIVDNVQLTQDDNDSGNNNYYYHISDLEMPHGARNNKITLYYNDGDDDGEAAEDEDGIEEEQQEQLLVGQPEIGVNFGNEYYYCHVMDNPAMSSLYDEENAQYFDYYADGNYCHLFAAQEDGVSTTNLVGGTDEDDGNNDNAGTIVGGGGGGGSMCFETETTKFVRHNPCYSGGGGNNHGEYYEGEGYYEGPFNGDDEVYGNNGWATSGESQSSSYTSFSIVGIIMITLLSLVIVGVCCCLVCFAIHRLHHHRSNNNGSGGHRRFSPHNWNTKNSNSTTNPSIENSDATTNISSNQHQAPPEAEEDPQEGQQSQHPSESVQPSSSLVIVQPPMTTSPPQQTEIPMVAAMPFVDAHEDTAVTTTANAVSPPIVNAVLLGDDEK